MKSSAESKHNDDDDDEEEEEEEVGQPLQAKRKSRILDSDSDEEAGDADCEENNLFLVESSMPPLRLDSESHSPPSSSHAPSADLSSRPLQGDSGIGQSLEQTQQGVVQGARRNGEVLEEMSNGTSVTADSLEFSFQWEQSLPLAQPWNPHNAGGVARTAPYGDDATSTQDMWAESQATPSCATAPTESQFPPSQEVDDAETQFLDEDG